MKRILTVTVLLLCLALVLGLSSCMGKSEKKETPLDILRDVMEKTAASYENDDSALWEKALSGGSIEYTADFGDDLLLKSLTAKNFYGKEKAVSTLFATAASGGTLDLTAYSSAKDLILSSSLFEDNYGVTLDGLADLLANMSGSAQSLTDQTKLAKIYEEIFLAIGDKAEDIVMKHIDIKVTTAESSLTITVSATSDELVSICTELIDSIKNDEKLLDSLAEGLTATLGEETTSEMIYDYLEEANAVDVTNEESFVIDAKLTCSKNRILQRATLFVYEQKDDETVGDRLFGLTVALPENGGFDMELEIEGETIVIKYKVDEDDHQRKDTFSIGARGITLTPVSLVYHKADHTYELTVEIPSVFKMTAAGSYTANDEQAVFTLGGITLTLNNAEEDLVPLASDIKLPITVNLTVKATDTMPEAPTNFIDATTLSEEKIDELGDTLLQNDVVLALVEMLSVLGDYSTPEALLPIS